jgi:hypothetical protein
VMPKADGEECSFHTECQRDHVCSRIPSDLVWRCYSYGEENEPCDPRGCADGLYCVAESCTPPSGENEDCDPALGNCEVGLLCMDDLRCHAPGDSVGDACQATNTESCEDAWTCATASSMCALPAAEDAACNPDFYDRACADGLYCHRPEGSGAPTCKALIADGQPCDGQGCESSICTEGTCRSASGCRSVEP